MFPGRFDWPLDLNPVVQIGNILTPVLEFKSFDAGMRHWYALNWRKCPYYPPYRL